MGGEGWVSHGGEGWVRSSRGKGWVRSSQGGSGPAVGGGQVQLSGGWVRSSQGGGSGPTGRGGGQVQLAGGGSAKIEQHREYLLHGGRYASCVHAGGLSC